MEILHSSYDWNGGAGRYKYNHGDFSGARSGTGRCRGSSVRNAVSGNYDSVWNSGRHRLVGFGFSSVREENPSGGGRGDGERFDSDTDSLLNRNYPPAYLSCSVAEIIWRYGRGIQYGVDVHVYYRRQLDFRQSRIWV